MHLGGEKFFWEGAHPPENPPLKYIRAQEQFILGTYSYYPGVGVGRGELDTCLRAGPNS